MKTEKVKSTLLHPAVHCLSTLFWHQCSSDQKHQHYKQVHKTFCCVNIYDSDIKRQKVQK